MSPLLVQMSFFLLILVSSVSSKVQKGVFTSLPSSSGWHYLARFCFRAGKGHSTTSEERRLSWEIEFTSEMCCPVLNIYYDSARQWHGVYRSNMSCEDKVSRARAKIQLKYPTCVLDEATNTYKCKSARYIYSSRPRWWYLALSHCGTPGYTLNYTLTFTNGDTLSDKHFSADELGVMEMNYVSTCVMLILVSGTLLYTQLLKRRKFYHVTFKTYQASVVFYLCSCVVLCVYYTLTATQGTAPLSLYIAAQSLIVVSTSCFLGLLLMFSKGYSIVLSTLSTQGFTEVLIFTTTFTMLMLYCVIWEQGAFDPADVVYLYQSPPGYMLTALYLAAWFYFILNCVRVGVKFAQKRNFYLMLGGFYSLWLVVVPLIILISNTVVQDYSRMKTVFISQQIVWQLSYIFLFVLFTPTRSNKHFPFHLRSTHVSDGMGVQAAENNYNVTTQERDVGDMFRVGYHQQPGAYDPRSMGHKAPETRASMEEHKAPETLENGYNPENGGPVPFLASNEESGSPPIQHENTDIAKHIENFSTQQNENTDNSEGYHVYDNDRRVENHSDRRDNGARRVSVLSLRSYENQYDNNVEDTVINGSAIFTVRS